MIKELERVALTTDLPEYHLQTGDIGTVVNVYDGGTGYEVEFFTLNDETLDVITLAAAQVRAFGKREIAHARALGH